MLGLAELLDVLKEARKGFSLLQGFGLRPEAGRLIRSFSIPCPVLL